MGSLAELEVAGRLRDARHNSVSGGANGPQARERYDSDIENERMVLGALNEFMVGEKRALPGDAMNEQSCKKQRTDSAVWDSVLESDDDDFTLPFIDVDDEEMGDEDTDEDC